MKKLLIIIPLLFLTGCSKNLMKQTEKLSDAIVDLIYYENYDISKLNSENKQIINNLLEKEKIENKVINISALNVFSEDIHDIRYGTSKGVYQKNNEYFIKYTDLDFKTNANSLDSIAYIYVDGYSVAIAKDDYPILRVDTCNNENYRYRYIKRKKEKNEINYYYRSFGNGSILTIKYILENNKIKDVDLVFGRYDENI